MVDYSYFWSGGEPIISCFVHHWLTSMPNVKHTEYLKNTNIVHYKYPKAFIVERRPEIIVRKNDYKKLLLTKKRVGGDIWKSPTWIQVLLWSSNPVFNVGGQAGPGNEIWNVEQSLTRKIRLRQKHIFFSLPPLHSVVRPPALFFSRRFMTESSRFKGSSSGHRDTQGHSASRTNQRIKSLLCGVQRQHCKVYFELRWN